MRLLSFARIAAGILILSLGSTALGQQASGEFSAALEMIIAAAKDGFRPIRGEVLNKDKNGNPTWWRSTVQIPSANSTTTIHAAQYGSPISAGVTLFESKDAQQTRQAYQDAVQRVRASLPASSWTMTERTLHGPVESKTTRFRYQGSEWLNVTVFYRTSTDRGHVALRVDGPKESGAPPSPAPPPRPAASDHHEHAHYHPHDSSDHHHHAHPHPHYGGEGHHHPY